MPWLNTPKERQTIFVEPSRPRGGLLGGSSASSGKMSKLQALAAARKKKAEDQKSEKVVKETTQQVDKLSLTSPALKENVRPLGSAFGKRPAETKAAERLGQQDKEPKPEPPPEKVATQSTQQASSPTTENMSPLENTAPSAFAQALLGPTTTSIAPAPRNQYPFPYMNFTSSVTDAFSEPSPDDKVLTAQSKGSLSAKRVLA